MPIFNKTIQEIQKKYHSKISPLDLEVLIAFVLKKERAFILTHPEYVISFSDYLKLSKLIKRRIKSEPIAYLVGHKEFFGLDFLVNKFTLIPRPETELIVEEIINSHISKDTTIIDIGTGSGNIIISVASNLPKVNSKISFIGTDISKRALAVAKENSTQHGLGDEIEFFNESLLEPIIKKYPLSSLGNHIIITANLPYLSEEIYDNSPEDVRKYEPKTALFSPQKGLWHYTELLKQINTLLKISIKKTAITLLLEISPEQKDELHNIIRNITPQATLEFKKDLADKWRICKIEIA